ncbi:elongation of fatty acids protein 3-like [Ananas comosus]|uniref:Elongation of fatty acids protein 3-like n=1 Tax=Ananas comosus TaxID=4615 RepID=A0A199VNS5_ANACO|nr:elongation of fatty acids protein 3-like [Ananas comosus]OAY78842.1 Elongation of fatty acids protein 3-like [Ananas comosus]
MRGITYWLAEHPAIVGFRWSHAQSWGSTWSFLISSLALCVVAAAALHLALCVLLRHRRVPLGPVPALHSLVMALASGAIFLGTLLSALAEIRDSRWAWRGRSRNSPLQWLLCFPLGTRPSGRVFFWSYAFYLSRFLHLLRAFFAILRRAPNPLARVFSHCALVAMSFLWLEFSQSFQVPAILAATLAHAVVFGYRFWVGVGLPVAPSVPVVLGCQLALLCCNLVCHVGVLFFHFGKGGCNGIGAWVFNSVLNGALLWVFLVCYARKSDGRVVDRSGPSVSQDESKKER